jgi:hypothetical protein
MVPHFPHDGSASMLAVLATICNSVWAIWPPNYILTYSAPLWSKLSAYTLWLFLNIPKDHFSPIKQIWKNLNLRGTKNKIYCGGHMAPLGCSLVWIGLWSCPGIRYMPCIKNHNKNTFCNDILGQLTLSPTGLHLLHRYNNFVWENIVSNLIGQFWTSCYHQQYNIKLLSTILI